MTSTHYHIYFPYAWHDGFTNGQADKRVGLRIDSAWYAVNSNDDYEREYAQGYRFGWESLLNTQSELK
jgi:hypothetical protein